MSPAWHYGLRLVIRATQYGILGACAVLSAKPEIDQRVLLVSTVAFLLPFATRIIEGLDALPPIYPVPPKGP